jgi:hypothetical protein
MSLIDPTERDEIHDLERPRVFLDKDVMFGEKCPYRGFDFPKCQSGANFESNHDTLVSFFGNGGIEQLVEVFLGLGELFDIDLLIVGSVKGHSRTMTHESGEKLLE